MQRDDAPSHPSADAPHERLSPGTVLAPLTVMTLAHGELSIPGDAPPGGFLHLQFRRFAGCPVCNLHLRSFARGLERLHAARVRTVAFFHSSASEMAEYQGDLPFASVPDPEREWYRRFGVEQSFLAPLHPSVVWSALRGLTSVRSSPFAGRGGQLGLPADFLIDGHGTVRAAHYGTHAADHWEVDDVISLSQET